MSSALVSASNAKAVRDSRSGALSIMLVLLACSAFINYIDRGNLSIAAPLLKNELGISVSQLGILLSSFAGPIQSQASVEYFFQQSTSPGSAGFSKEVRMMTDVLIVGAGPTGLMITDLQPRPVEMWLESLPLSPKSKAHIRGVLSRVWDYAMWRGDVPSQRNPMSLVDIRGASKRTKKPKSLTIIQAQNFLSNLPQPFHEIALLCLLLGLRISECLALRWVDLDWLRLRLSIDRSIVNQTVEDVKTSESRRNMPLDPSLMEVLKAWKQTSKFSDPSDWMFASPYQLGRLPWSYDQVWRVYQKAASAAGIGTVGTHSLRHTYRSLLDSVGTPLAVQQKLMRHTDIRTTMNVYGDVITNQESEALAKIARLALANSTQAARGIA